MHHLIKMWLWILISFNVVYELQGYANGNFPQSCRSMLPENHAGAKPQTRDPPYELTYKNSNSRGDPVTVTLQSKNSKEFIGFMLQARSASLDGNGPAIGKFIPLDSGTINLLSCDGIQDSAVSQRDNWEKTSISVNWTSQEAEYEDIIFRATVLEKYTVFWERVVRHYQPPTPPPSPSSTTFPPSPSSSSSSTSPSSPTPPPPRLRYKVIGMMTMSPGIFVVSVAWAVAQCFSSYRYNLNKDLLIFNNATCAVFAILSLVFFLLDQPITVAVVVLQSVVILLIFIELILLKLPLGPSHELKEICGIVRRVFSTIHRVLTLGVILCGVVSYCTAEVHVCEEKRIRNWFLIVLILYTVWIVITEICVFLLENRKESNYRKIEKRVQRKANVSLKA